MTTQQVVWYGQERWRVLETSTTSDGFIMGMAQLLDEDGEAAADEDGWPVMHSVFLGRIRT